MKYYIEENITRSMFNTVGSKMVKADLARKIFLQQDGDFGDYHVCFEVFDPVKIDENFKMFPPKSHPCKKRAEKAKQMIKDFGGDMLSVSMTLEDLSHE